MTIGPGEIDRVAPRDFVELRTRGKLWSFPKRLDPAATYDPFPRLRLRNALLYLAQKIGARVCAFEIQMHLELADSKHLPVGIVPPGDDGFAVNINNAGLRAGEFFCFIVRANKDDLVLLHCDR